MRTILFALAIVTLIGGGSANVKAQGVIQQMNIMCFPSLFMENTMLSSGLIERLQGAFDDGDLLLVYRNEAGRFAAGFATADGRTCVLGSGTGLELENPEPKGSGS